MLHLQLWAGWQPAADHIKRRDGERTGDHAGHTAGRVPACVGRDRSVRLDGRGSRESPHRIDKISKKDIYK